MNVCENKLFICGKCGTDKCTALNTYEGRYVSWCDNGHIVLGAEPGRAKHVHTFDMASKAAPTPNQDTKPLKCDICEGEIRDKSLDFMVGHTIYDESGEIMDALVEVPTIEDNYMVVCDGCVPGVIEVWDAMWYLLRSRGA